MNDRNFEPLLTLYRAVTFRAGREATLTVADQATHDALVTCLDDVDEFSVTLTQGDPDNIPVGSTVDLAFSDPRTGRGVLAEHLLDLLQSPTYRVREPRNYFLIDKRFASGDTPVPDDVKRYRRVLEFVQLLKKAAAYLDPDAGTLVFVHGGKFELPVNYTTDTLARMDDAALSKLLSFVGDDAHDEQKLGILEGAVRGMLEHLDASSRFERLLKHLPELVTKANDGYRLFIANFSYDKVRDSLEATKVEYATKIHKAFSDIQTQILTIPVATVVVASQMKSASTVGYEFWLNSAVLIGCWVFVVLVAFVLANQFHTLGVLADEIDRQRTTLTREYRDIADRFDDVFKFLQKRLWLQRCALFAVGAVLVIGLVLAHVVYFKLTDPASAWLSGASAASAGAPASGVSAASGAAPTSAAVPTSTSVPSSASANTPASGAASASTSAPASTLATPASTASAASAG